MSAAILIISGLHAIPPIAGAYLTKSKIGLTIGAIAGATVAIAIGGGAYAIFDLVGVAIGCFVGYGIVEEYTDSPSPQEEKKDSPEKEISSDKGFELPPTFPKPAPTINYNNFYSGASYIVGNRTTVRGKVAHVATFHNRTLMSIGEKFPKEEISLLIWNDKRAALVNKFGNLELLKGKSITCNGVVSIYQGHLQVRITNPDQLNIADQPNGMDEFPF